MWQLDRTNLQTREKILAQDRVSFRAQQELQLLSFSRLVMEKNAFFAQRSVPLEKLECLDDFLKLPLLRKSELIGSDGYAANLTFARDHYRRFHRTSGTTGRPLVVLDSGDDWQWWMESWQYVLDTAQLSSSDRVLMAFSFGPFVGFWSAFDAVAERDALVMPTGSLSSEARLELILDSQATVVFCTPSYAMHLAQVAQAKGLPLDQSAVRVVVVAGEPGGSVPEMRRRIESAWKARVIDHSGATEIGPWGFADAEGRGLFVNESQFFPEFLDLESGRRLRPDSEETEGVVCQLVLSTIGRLGCPVLRYVTGDLVRPSWRQDAPFVFLQGGVIGRADDMLIIRGVNVFPSALEEILRSFEAVQEFQLIAWKDGQMDQLKIKVEDDLNQPQRIADAIQVRLGLRVEVEVVPADSLPRFEMKGKRFLDQR